MPRGGTCTRIGALSWAAMDLIVNDKPVHVHGSCSVAELLERLNLGRAACAVEVNREVVPRARHADRRLAPGDRIEIVTLVGGG
jgi:sulfur carrier protein